MGEEWKEGEEQQGRTCLTMRRIPAGRDAVHATTQLLVLHGAAVVAAVAAAAQHNGVAAVDEDVVDWPHEDVVPVDVLREAQLRVLRYSHAAVANGGQLVESHLAEIHVLGSTEGTTLADLVDDEGVGHDQTLAPDHSQFREDRGQGAQTPHLEDQEVTRDLAEIVEAREVGFGDVGLRDHGQGEVALQDRAVPQLSVGGGDQLVFEFLAGSAPFTGAGSRGRCGCPGHVAPVRLHGAVPDVHRPAAVLQGGP